MNNEQFRSVVRFAVGHAFVWVGAFILYYMVKS